MKQQDADLQALKEVLFIWQRHDYLAAEIGTCELVRKLRSVRWALIRSNRKNTDIERGDTFISFTSDLIMKKCNETEKLGLESPLAQRWLVLLHHLVLQSSVKETQKKLWIEERTVYRRLAEAKSLLLAELRTEDARLLEEIIYYDEFHDRICQIEGHVARPHQLAIHWRFLQGDVVNSHSKTTVIDGPPGVGKTSLGLSLGRKYQSEFQSEVFWHTFTDNPHNIEDLLYHAAGFFAVQGDLRLWNAIHLQGEADVIDSIFLSCAIESGSLLCIDNCHFIEANEPITTLLWRLSESSCRVLLISRETPSFVSSLIGPKLSGMTSNQSLSMMRRSGIKLEAASSSFRTLYSSTGGNPQLLLYSAELMRSLPAQSRSSLLSNMPTRETVWAYIVGNFIHVLTDIQQEVLASLCFVFNGKADKASLYAAIEVSSAMDTIYELIKSNILIELEDGSVENHQILTDWHRILGFAHFGIRIQGLNKKHVKVADHQTSVGQFLDAAEHYMAANRWTRAINVLHHYFEDQSDSALIISMTRQRFFALFNSLPVLRGNIAKDSWILACLYRGLNPSIDRQNRMHWLEEAISNSSDPQIVALIAIQLISVYGNVGRLEEAVKVYNETKWSDSDYPTSQIYALSRLANAYHTAGSYHTAITYAQEATHLMTSSEDYQIEALISAYQILGKSLEMIIKNDPKLWSDVIETYQKRLSLVSNLSNGLTKEVRSTTALIDLGKALYASGDRESGISNLLKALNTARCLSGVLDIQFWALLAWAEVQYAEGNYRIALTTLGEALELSRKYTYSDAIDRAMDTAGKWLATADYHIQNASIDLEIKANATLAKGYLLNSMDMKDESAKFLRISIDLCSEARISGASDESRQYINETEAEARTLLAKHYTETEEFEKALYEARLAKLIFHSLNMPDRVVELNKIIEDIA